MKEKKYLHLHQLLRERLQDMLPGEKLESVRSLQRRYQVSLSTLNSALKLLTEEGLLCSVQYKGLYRSRPTADAASRTVVLVLPGREEPLFQRIILSCYEALRARNISMQLSIYRLNLEAEVQTMREVLERRPDGVLYMPTTISESLKELLRSWAQVLPLVQINREVGEPFLSFVGNQCQEASRLATEMLIRAGHRRIGVIRSSNAHFCLDQQERLAGFHQALQEAGIPFSPQWEIAFDSLDPTISSDVVSLLMSPERPTAFFATNSVFLPQLLQKAAFCKVKVPEELSVTSFDLKESFDNLPLKVSYLAQPMEGLCARGVEMLNEMMTCRDLTPRRELLAPAPCPGETCLPPPKAVGKKA